MIPYRSKLTEHQLTIYPVEKIATALRKLTEVKHVVDVGIARPVALSAPEKIEQVKSSQKTAANIHTDALLQKTKFASDFGRCKITIHTTRTNTSLLYNN
ncbi:hypothetical protein D917_05519 [Trichinella nativa]|uniref:Uncharacterized protein n=1 Tax=Trichinella nativa TaxID=6335 RepID=A0A1Y3EVV2_9BILA|nr:hypothetical protein D917_05519 [Trichinella nativa]